MAESPVIMHSEMFGKNWRQHNTTKTNMVVDGVMIWTCFSATAPGKFAVIVTPESRL